MGKGSAPRPFTNRAVFEDNFDRIFGNKKSRIDVVGQNGNDGLHYEYELNKSSGEVEKRFLDGINKPNEEQFNGRQESNTVNISETPEGTVPTSSDSGKVE